jgi:hypothetical protein
MNVYIILFIVIMMILLCKKEENMCSCGRGLDYYGHMKCMDMMEARRRNPGLFRDIY